MNVLASRAPFLILALALAGATARGQAKVSGAATQTEIDASIDRGVAHLLERYAAGSRSPADVARNGATDQTGLRALALYTLLACGVPRDHPTVETLLARLALDRHEGTYDAACMTLALAKLDASRGLVDRCERELERAWLAELAGRLLATQRTVGDWGYPGGADLSNTQFAALALHAASSAGVVVPASLWTELASGVMRYRASDGGFGYQAGDATTSTGSMTAAGVGTLAVCEIELARAGVLTTETERDLHRLRSKGIEWLARELSIASNPRSGAWNEYWRYALERVGGFAGVERLGPHDWYSEGATAFVREQGDDGAWNGTFGGASTCFALLFLRRATLPQDVPTGRFGARPSVPTGTPESGFLPPPAAHETMPKPLVRFRVACNAADEDRALRLWIEGPLPVELRRRGEEAPRVLRVEYVDANAPERPIAIVLGDGEHGPSTSRFACELSAYARSPYGARRTIVARARIELPPSPRTGARSTVVTAESEPLAVEIVERPRNDPIDAMQAARIALGRAQSSSTWRDADTCVAYGPERACDENPRAPWIASPDDATPVLHLAALGHGRAARVIATPARIVPRSPDALAMPLGVELRVNGGKPRAMEPSGRVLGAFELALDPSTDVTSLELRITSRSDSTGAARAVGFGEVELVAATTARKRP